MPPRPKATPPSAIVALARMWVRLAFAWSLSACGDRAAGRSFIPDVVDGVDSLGAATHFSLGDDDPADLEWQPCPRFTGADDSDAECATVSAPLVRDDASEAAERFIDVFVKRWPAADESRGQLWLLQGGPGISGVSLERMAELLAPRVPDLDIYIPDHRGTGRSQLFECRGTLRDQDQDLPTAFRNCAEEIDVAWGASARGFRTTEAARDVIDLIDATRQDGDDVFVHGGSYGGYWLHRVLQIAPDLVSGAIFESSAPPRGQLSMVDLLLDREQAGHYLLEACSRDEFCASRLGADTEEAAARIIEGADGCDALVDADIDSEVLRLLLTEALLFAPTRVLVPALLARARACTVDDANFLVDFFTATADAAAEEPEPADPTVADSIALLFQINLSELHSEQVDRATLERTARETLFPETRLAFELNEALSYWPVYERRAPEGDVAAFDRPVLVFHGTFDPRTGVSIGRDLGELFAGPTQHYFEFPYGGHGVIYGSHDVGDGTTCGETVLVRFLEDPTQEPDASCIDDAPPPDFRGDPDVVEALSGQRDAWPEP